MVRSVLYIFIGIMISAAVLLFARGPEDSWICTRGVWVKHGHPATAKPIKPCPRKGAGMKLTSSAFSAGGMLPTEFTCKGLGMSPPFTITGIPARTQTLALTLDDPDAPGGTFHHWTVWNMPAGTTEIARDHLPDGSVMGTNSAGQSAYMPPCPPTGMHRYIFTLYALDKPLNLADGAARAEFVSTIRGHVILQAELTGFFGTR